MEETLLLRVNLFMKTLMILKLKENVSNLRNQIVLRPES